MKRARNEWPARPFFCPFSAGSLAAASVFVQREFLAHVKRDRASMY
jgi:hypothetical protein